MEFYNGNCPLTILPSPYSPTRLCTCFPPPPLVSALWTVHWTSDNAQCNFHSVKWFPQKLITFTRWAPWNGRNGGQHRQVSLYLYRPDQVLSKYSPRSRAYIAKGPESTSLFEKNYFLYTVSLSHQFNIFMKICNNNLTYDISSCCNETEI
jgi:hypothetical protein